MEGLSRRKNGCTGEKSDRPLGSSGGDPWRTGEGSEAVRHKSRWDTLQVTGHVG